MSEGENLDNLCAECGGTAIFCERDHLQLYDARCPVDLAEEARDE